MWTISACTYCIFAAVHPKAVEEYKSVGRSKWKANYRPLGRETLLMQPKTIQKNINETHQVEVVGNFLWY